MYVNASLILNEIAKAEDETLKKAYWLVSKKSSGKYKAEKLARMGHPYAVRHHAYGINGTIIPYGDPSIINRQSGEFALSWHTKKPTVKGNALVSSLYNSAVYADKLAEGIPGLTIARPVIPSIIRTVEFWRMRYLSKAIVRAIEAMKP